MTRELEFHLYTSFIARQTCHSLYVRFHIVVCHSANSYRRTLSTFRCTAKRTCFTSLHTLLWPFSKDSHIHQNDMLLLMYFLVVICNMTESTSVSLVYGKFVVVLG
jgi:hypothetical protein